jgi:predicted small lipoprotein YifL
MFVRWRRILGSLFVIATRFQARLAVLGLIVLALGLSACGRKGPLDPPPGASAGTQPEAAQPSGPGAIFGAPAPAEEAPPEATKGQKRRIILDGLLN